ncbi:MAG: 3-hydroxyacyl-ACP dehydratase FabZ family protein [Desulfobulbus oligotrophicus]|jgi:3-hydroxyacyl-[acyl-carrier-protein] dehydratase|nr:3-hydroxyacyl-ACP dehydratase FabZ family protein [Desulfobulbus oligotrophicus]
MKTPVDPFILERIPHRPPFLWLDRVLDVNRDCIRAEKTIPHDLPLLQGHYPGYPLMPGVLLCEMVFQAGALLISEMMRGTADNDDQQDRTGGVPVLTRILGAKFKREARPGDLLEITASLVERVGPAWFMKGAVRVDGKVAVQVEFACTRKGS